jgi:hypothetical protein
MDFSVELKIWRKQTKELLIHWFYRTWVMNFPPFFLQTVHLFFKLGKLKQRIAFFFASVGLFGYDFFLVRLVSSLWEY